jgi:hypothetical protein
MSGDWIADHSFAVAAGGRIFFESPLEVSSGGSTQTLDHRVTRMQFLRRSWAARHSDAVLLSTPPLAK